MPFTPILPTPLLTWLLFLVAIFALLTISEWLAARTGMRTEHSRQLVHVIVGVFIFLCRFIFQEPLYPLITGLLFVGINLATLHLDRFKSMHATDRLSYGTVYYPLSFVILVALFWHWDPVALQVAVLLLAFADPLAAWVGHRYGHRGFTLWRDPKTIEGTGAMFLGSIVLILAGLVILIPLSSSSGLSGGAGQTGLSWPQLLAAVIPLAALATIAEAQSSRGSDNITVPLAAALFLFLFRSLPPGSLIPFVLWTTGSAVLLGLAARFKALALSGALTAWSVGMLIFLSGGWAWVIPIVAFFILSSILTRFNRGMATTRNPDHGAGQRNLVQVFANGGVPLLVAAACGIWGPDRLYLVFLAALAAATADTWGTEIGGWSKGQPRNIVTWRPVARGDSGGVTLVGTIGTLAGAAFLAAVGLWLQPRLVSGADWLIISIIGFLAATIDSLLGATVQARYLIPATGRITENRTTGGPEVVLHSGWQWLDNNMVNLVCTGSGAILGLLWLVI
ncbi:MAG: DUF92 domain-containing protein [Calditrichaeota bacterium]|nr:DUF92 domain-containing protein [Calditrichota bacterium]